MRAWAFGTSPHGLGLTNDAFWDLTPREYFALRDIQQAQVRRWAISQALAINVHLSSDAEPFTADDFMGLGNREERTKEREASKLRVMLENRRIDKIKPVRFQDDDEPENLPQWARMRPDERARLPKSNPKKATPAEVSAGLRSPFPVRCGGI